METQEDFSLEHEFAERVERHKTAIVCGALMKEYLMKEKAKEGPQIPECLLMEQAEEYANRVAMLTIAQGTYDALYEALWKSISAAMPDDLCVG